VLGGRDLNFAKFREFVRDASIVIAADGGAHTSVELGRAPDIVIGDLDSLSSELRSELSDVRHDEDQMTTDADKLLTLAWSLGHSKISLIGIEGDLPDHVLATLHSASRSPVEVDLIFRRGTGWTLSGGSERILVSHVGQRISLLPLGACEGVTLTGVRWPLEEAALSAEGWSSISNEAVGTEVSVRVGSGTAFLFVEDE
jgi:thiamine pyrophosphokinase